MEENKNYSSVIPHLNIWRDYLKLSISVQDSTLKHFIYSSSSSDMEKLQNKPKDLNTIERSIYEKPNADIIIQYLKLVNVYKKSILVTKDNWNYSSYTNITSREIVDQFIATCENLKHKSDDVFLKWRLLYVILRASHFNKYHALAIAKFEKYYGTFTKDNSLAQFWCEGVYGGAQIRMKHDDKGIYYSARAFANCPDLHLEAMNTYLFSNRQWKSALPFCKNASDSIYVAMLEGANHPMPTMEFINMVYKTNPNSEVLTF